MEFLILIIGFALTIAGTTIVWIRNREFPRVSCLVVVTILIISLCVGTFLLANLRTGRSVGGGGNSVSDTNISGLRIEITWPLSVVKDQSFPLQVLIGLTPAPTASATTQPDQVQAQNQLTPVGTPKMPIAKAFGSGFDAFANAELSASAFEIDPQQQAQQSLDQESVSFYWTLTPKYTQDQTLSITVTAVWKPRSGGEPTERPLARHLLHINVSDAPLSVVPGELSLSDLIAALISSALNIPWVVELLKKRQEARADKNNK